MNDLAIYGAGGFGRETALMIAQINAAERAWRVTGFFDDGITKGTTVDGMPVLGGIREVNEISKPLALVMAIADPGTRRQVAAAIDNPAIKYPVVAHPTAILGGETNFLGRGSIITAGCILTVGVVTGEFTIVNLATTLGHDVKLGSFCTIMPGCNVSGNVQIGAGTMMGTGARILQNLSVGPNCRVGAGAVVTKSFDGEDLTLVGVPARIA